MARRRKRGFITIAQQREMWDGSLHVPYRLRQLVLERDEYLCRYCGRTGILTMDHVVPVSLGGLSTFENLVTACKPCNNKKDMQLWTPKPVGYRYEAA